MIRERKGGWEEEQRGKGRVALSIGGLDNETCFEKKKSNCPDLGRRKKEDGG